MRDSEDDTHMYPSMLRLLLSYKKITLVKNDYHAKIHIGQTKSNFKEQAEAF